MTDIIERLRDRNAIVMTGLYHAVPAMNEAADEIERLRGVLERCRTILGNMALENDTGLKSIFDRWPISHEPLRADAKGLLPVIDAALTIGMGN